MILALLSERPMHPYEMQRLMVARGDDRVVRVQRGSLYPAVERLERAGLVEADTVERSGKRPERTVYRITDEGRRTGLAWITEMMSRVKEEFPEFGAAMSFVAMLDSKETEAALSRRRAQLSGQVEEHQSTLEYLTGRLPRLFMVELEYVLAMRRAERDFIDGLLGDIRDGFVWDAAQVRRWYLETVDNGELPGSEPHAAEPNSVDPNEPEEGSTMPG
jgi:DNA-binding PadR family transcriptional regulator